METLPMYTLFIAFSIVGAGFGVVKGLTVREEKRKRRIRELLRVFHEASLAEIEACAETGCFYYGKTIEELISFFPEEAGNAYGCLLKLLERDRTSWNSFNNLSVTLVQKLLQAQDGQRENFISGMRPRYQKHADRLEEAIKDARSTLLKEEAEKAKRESEKDRRKILNLGVQALYGHKPRFHLIDGDD